MSQPTRVVVLGGGFAGVTAARRLERHFGCRTDVEVTVVDGENFSLFTPLLPEVPSGSTAVPPLRRSHQQATDPVVSTPGHPEKSMTSPCPDRSLRR